MYTSSDGTPGNQFLDVDAEYDACVSVTCWVCSSADLLLSVIQTLQGVCATVLRCVHLFMQDVSLVRSLLQRHSRYTASPKAKALLSDWKTTQAHFVKIFPHEYRRALGEAEKTKVRLASSSI